MIENLKLQEKYDKNDVKQIFSEIDSDKQGEIGFNDFIQILFFKSSKNLNEKYTDFYFSAIKFYLTPSEQIIETIKKAMNKLDNQNENSKLIKELEWVIQTLSEKDLFDFRLKDEFINEETFEDNDVFKFLSEYSNDVFKRQKNHDLESINLIQLNKKKAKDCNY